VCGWPCGERAQTPRRLLTPAPWLRQHAQLAELLRESGSPPIEIVQSGWHSTVPMVLSKSPPRRQRTDSKTGRAASLSPPSQGSPPYSSDGSMTAPFPHDTTSSPLSQSLSPVQTSSPVPLGAVPSDAAPLGFVPPPLDEAYLQHGATFWMPPLPPDAVQLTSSARYGEFSGS
jgi:hypothetical protein